MAPIHYETEWFVSPPPNEGFTITCLIYHSCSSLNMHHNPFYVINCTDMLHPYNDVL